MSPDPLSTGSPREAESDEPSERRPSRGRPPLSIIFVLPFLLLLSLVVGLTAWLFLRQGEQAIAETTHLLRQEVGQRTHDYLLDFLDEPKLINEINAQAIALGELKTTDSPALGRHFHRQLDAFPNASFIFFGSRHGGAAGAGRDDSPTAATTIDTTPVEPSLGLLPGNRFEYRADASGQRGELLRIDEGFDSRQRPWFRQAVAAEDAVWTPVYPLFNDHSLAIAASRPVWDAQGQLIGVLAVDLRLAGIQRYLSNLRVGTHGQVFVIERDGLLIASSNNEDLLVDPRGDDTWLRRRADQSRSPLIRQTAEFLHRRDDNLRTINTTQQLSAELLADLHYIEVVPLRDGRGIDWLIVIVVPRSDFIGPLLVSRQRTLWLVAVAFVLASLLGWLTARWLSLPLRRLASAARLLAKGQLSERAVRGGSREIDNLAQTFNTMAGQLQASITDLEHRVAQRTEELSRAKEAAEAADRAKSRFLANVSHELRTPLSTVLGYSELLATAPQGSLEGRLFLKTVRQQGRHLSELLADLIDLGRIETGSFELHPEMCSLQGLIEQLRSLFAPQADDKGLDLFFTVATPVPWIFRSDATRLRQILSNLLSNAIRYTQRGEVRCTIRVVDPTASVDAPQRATQSGSESSIARLRFDVSDTGIGIAPGDQQGLFDHFVRLPASEAANSGFGLGLAIAHQLSALMDGRIELDSEPGVGSCFSLSLTVEHCAQWSGTPRKEVADETPDQPLSKLSGTILVADDSANLRDLYQHMLGSWGLRCRFANDGQRAVALARRQRFDAILMDWQMPDVDGLAATRQLRAEGVKTPIIALTAATSSGDRERCLEAGCSDYLIKPIDFPRLHRLLSDLLPPNALTPAVKPVATTPGKTVTMGPTADPEVQRLTRAYLLRLPEQLHRLRALVTAEDWQGLATTGHRLAGTAGTFDLPSVARYAERLEAAAILRRAQDCLKALSDLQRQVANAIDSLQSP